MPSLFPFLSVDSAYISGTNDGVGGVGEVAQIGYDLLEGIGWVLLRNVEGQGSMTIYYYHNKLH